MFTGYQMYQPKTEIDFNVSRIYRLYNFENFKNIHLNLINSNQNRKFKWEEMGFNFDLKAGF